MNIIRWLVGALIGGAVGAGIWALVAIKTNSEIGYIAWGIGGLCGFMVRKFSAPHMGSKPAGVIAAVVALASIGAGKFIPIEFALHQFAAESPELTDQDLLIRFASDVVEERAQATKTEKTPEPAVEVPVDAPAPPETFDDYPEDVKKVARERFEKLTPEERTRLLASMRQELQDLLKMMKTGIREQAIKATLDDLGPLDLLFAFLAVSTAYKMGAAPVNPEQVQADPFAPPPGGDDPFGTPKSDPFGPTKDKNDPFA